MFPNVNNSFFLPLLTLGECLLKVTGLLYSPVSIVLPHCPRSISLPLCLMSIDLPHCSGEISTHLWHYSHLSTSYIYDGNTSHLYLPMTPDHSWPKQVVTILFHSKWVQRYYLTLSECRSTALGTSVVHKGPVFRTLNTTPSLTKFRVLRWLSIQCIYQVDTLAEVVLQNQRGLNLHLWKQGGLCSLWRTKFYARKSRTIVDTFATV